MSEEQVNPTPAPRKTLSPLGRRLLAIGLGVLTFFLVKFMIDIRLDAVRKATFSQGVNAFAQALVDPVLVSDQAKVRLAIERSAKAAGYDSVTVYGSLGQVLASTDRTKETSATLKINDQPDTAKVTVEAARLVGRRAIFLAEGNRIGAIEVVAVPK